MAIFTLKEYQSVAFLVKLPLLFATSIDILRPLFWLIHNAPVATQLHA
jgi:hypothetical protein